MSTIREKAEEILNEKNIKILPENIKAGVTVFNVAGTLQGLVGEEVAVTPTTEQQVITPSEGKTGITEVTVAPVDNTIDANIVAENIKKDVTILGVTGALEEGSGGGSVEGVRQFASIDEMQSSTGNEEGDLAVVYSISQAGITSTTQFQVCICPAVVVLPTAFTGELNFSMRAVDGGYFDGWGYFTPDYFDLSGYSDSGEIRISYNSTDGITYTRSSDTPEIVNFGMLVQYRGTWDDTISHFMLVESKYFGGLFNNISVADMTQVYFPLKESLMGTWDTDVNSTYVDNDKLFTLLDKFCAEQAINSTQNISIYQDVNDVVKLIVWETLDYTSVANYCDQLGDTTGTVGTYLGIGYRFQQNDNAEAAAVTIPIYSLDLENQTYTSVGSSGTTLIHYSYLGWNNRLYKLNNLNEKTCALKVILEFTDNVAHTTGELTLLSETDGASKYSVYNRHYLNWEPAPTQLNASAKDLLPSKTAYSSDGVIEGTEETYQNLDANMVMKHILGINDVDTETKKYYVSYLDDLIGTNTFSNVMGLDIDLDCPSDSIETIVALGETSSTTAPFTTNVSYPRSLQVGNDIYLLANSTNTFAHVRIDGENLSVLNNRTVSSVATTSYTYNMALYNGYLYAMYGRYSSSTYYLSVIKIDIDGSGTGTTYGTSTSSTYALKTSVGLIPEQNTAYFINTSGALYQWTFTGSTYTRILSGETFNSGTTIGQDCADYLFVPSTTKIHLINKATLEITSIAVNWYDTSKTYARILEDANYMYCMYAGSVYKISKSDLTLVATGRYSDNKLAGAGSSYGVVKTINGKIMFPSYAGWTTSTGVNRCGYLTVLDTETLKVYNTNSYGYGCAMYNILDNGKLKRWHIDGLASSSESISTYNHTIASLCDFLNGDIPAMVIKGYIYIKLKDNELLV